MGGKPGPGGRGRTEDEGGAGGRAAGGGDGAAEAGDAGGSGSAGNAGDIGDAGERAVRKRFDLNVAQVAGSAVAAVLAAKFASNLGVYGTILGAGVVSVVATCGGSVFQHVFRRTGEQLRDVAVQTKPRARQVPVPRSGRPVPRTFRPSATQARVVSDPAHTEWAMPADGPVPRTDPAGRIRPSAEFTEGTVHRARPRGWKRPLIAAGLVFGVAMGGITAYELASGHSLGDGGAGTTIGDVFTGRHPGSDPGPAHPRQPSVDPSGDVGQDGQRPGEQDGGTPRDVDPTPTPDRTDGTGTGPSTDPGPDTGTGTGPEDASPAPAPTTTPSGGAGSDTPQRGGPSAP